MVTQFNPRVKGFKKTYTEVLEHFEDEFNLQKLFDTTPIVVYSKHTNTGDLLIKSRLQ